MAVAGGLEGLGRQLHQVGTQVGVGQLQLTPALAPGKHRARFNDQVIDREVGRRQGHGLGQLLAPGGQPLLGQPLDQVQAPAGQIAPLAGLVEPGGRLQQVGAAVAPSQPFQHGVIETLAAQAHPVDAGGEITGQAGPIEAGRIHFQADLGPRGEAEVGSQGRQQGSHLGWGEHRGRAASDVHGGQGRPRWGGGNLAQQQLQVASD